MPDVSSNDITAIERLLSEPRIGPYRVPFPPEAGARWAQLYLWNLRLSTALWKPIALVEVGVRNALSDRMQFRHDRLGRHGSWIDAPARHRLSTRSLERIDEARRRASRKGGAGPDRITAELDLGFWRFLVAENRHLRLWRDLRRAFPGAPARDRRLIADRLGRINDARNRIAHHDPIWRRGPARVHTELLEIAAWLDPDFGRWVARCSPFADVLAEMPDVETLDLG